MQNKMAKERLSNFWYYYKWPALITALIVAILTFFTVQCATRIQADYSVVLYLNQSVSYEQRAALEEMPGKHVTGVMHAEIKTRVTVDDRPKHHHTR